MANVFEYVCITHYKLKSFAHSNVCFVYERIIEYYYFFIQAFCIRIPVYYDNQSQCVVLCCVVRVLNTYFYDDNFIDNTE